MIQPHARSKDLQTKKCNIANMLLNRETNKYQAAIKMMKAMAPLIKTCTDSRPTMGHVSSIIG